MCYFHSPSTESEIGLNPGSAYPGKGNRVALRWLRLGWHVSRNGRMQKRQIGSWPDHHPTNRGRSPKSRKFNVTVIVDPRASANSIWLFSATDQPTYYLQL
jgi:hypothetical protein